MSISIIGDYRLAFIKPGQVTGHDIVNIDLTPTPSPFSPWPKRAIGKVTESVAQFHAKGCGLMTKGNECRCPAWFKYLRVELKKNRP